jgi:vacuolar-type H+-ATPase subunit I/STV1
VRRLSVVAGGLLIAVAFAAATRVANTREGLIAEVITLLSGLAGMTLVFFGLFSGARPGGWGISAGWQWAALSAVVLLPMIAGSAVLCIRFLRTR